MLRLTICLTVAVLLLPRSAFSEIYRYVDENGNEYYTNTPLQKDAELIVKDKKAPAPAGADENARAYISEASVEEYKVIAEKTAKRYALDPDLVKAVIEIESGWNPRAVSSRGAIGLMQLMPETALEMGVGNPYDPRENIEGGVKYLKRLLRRFGDIELALAAYNAGPSVVKRYGSVPPYAETLMYVQDILFQYNNDGAKRAKQDGRGRERFYKVVFEDGRVLYTNTPVYLNGPSSF